MKQLPKLNFPGGFGFTDVSTWSAYKAWFSIDSRTCAHALYVHGRHAVIKSLEWRTNELADIMLDGSILRLYGGTYETDSGYGRDDDIQEGDMKGGSHHYHASKY